ncbi:MAG: response regulator [Myxococcota bacterium]
MSQLRANPEQPHILLVDDSEIVLDVISEQLERHGYAVTCANDVTTALTIADFTRLDLVITDVQMPGCSGLEMLARIRERVADVPVIMLSSQSDMKVVLNAVRNGAFDFVIKDEQTETLQWSIQRALAHLGVLRANQRLMKELRDANRALESRASLTDQLERSQRELLAERSQLRGALERLQEATEGGAASVAGDMLEPLRTLETSLERVRTWVSAVVRGDPAPLAHHEMVTVVQQCVEAVSGIGAGLRKLGVADNPPAPEAAPPLVGATER